MDQTLSLAEAERLLTRVFEANDVSPANAQSVARALVAAEVDGQGGHGFSRVASYVAQARSGKVDGHATPTLSPQGAAFTRIDAGGGFAFPAIDMAVDDLCSRVATTGLAGAGITRSHHCGQLGAHVERLAARGLVALMVANTPKAMAPWGGNRALFGTNPIAFAAPRADAAPLVIDLSLSKVARGKIMAAGKRGDPIPEGWALDQNGQPTTDPDAALGGMMPPMGDAKGAALALIVEVLAATVTGANHSHEASSFFEAEGPAPGVGQFILALDPGQSAGAQFGPRLEALLGEIEGQSGARLPGSGRVAARERAAQEGLHVPQHLMEEITRLAKGA